MAPHSSTSPHYPAAVLRLRLLGLALCLLGLWLGLANLIDAWIEFDPSYLAYFLRVQLLRPGLAVLFGFLVMAASRPLARRLTRDLDA